MPIRPENRGRYPKDWPEISRARKEAAGWHCEFCRAPHGKKIFRGLGKDKGTYMLPCGDKYDAETGQQLGRIYPHSYKGREVMVVLTVMHLNHQPEDNRPENLRAGCQRCHNAYDAPHRRQTARKRAALGDLFEGAK